MKRTPATRDRACHTAPRPAALVRLLDAVGVTMRDRQTWFTDIQILHDETTGVATLVIADADRRSFIERTFHEVLEAAVIAQGGRRLRISAGVPA